MRVSETSNEIEYLYDSISEIAAVGLRNLCENVPGGKLRKNWHGVSSVEQARKLASVGWLNESDSAMDIATESIESIEREHEISSFRPAWDVAGCEVDVARYLANEPENMIDYEISPTTRSGRVITVCASVSYSSAVSVGSIKRRGHSVAALAFALSKLGFAAELWADVSVRGKDGKSFGRMRVQVKGPNDALDPALIMFAYSHPAMLRAIVLPVMHEMPQRFQEALNVGRTYGEPVDSKRDLPDGAIYLPCIRSEVDVPDAKETLEKYLRELGILTT
ncbi:hypothetical protein [Amycolatopsis sp. cmx-4-68]|uniref:DUF7192 family protein n=1 Tax=Amycolatopsis sp. cmx-4-68 TaxID=2790938 RepID=UPI00397B6BD3